MINEDICTQLRMERQKELRDEVQQNRLATQAPGHGQVFARKIVGRLGSAMVAAGSRLEEFEHHGKPAMLDA